MNFCSLVKLGTGLGEKENKSIATKYCGYAFCWHWETGSPKVRATRLLEQKNYTGAPYRLQGEMRTLNCFLQSVHFHLLPLPFTFSS